MQYFVNDFYSDHIYNFCYSDAHTFTSIRCDVNSSRSIYHLESSYKYTHTERHKEIYTHVKYAAF